MAFGRSRQPKCWIGFELGLCKGLQRGTPLAERLGEQLFVFRVRQQIECDKQPRRFLRQFFDAARGGVNPLQQIVERKRLAARHHDFAVEQEIGRLQSSRGIDQLGEVAGEVLARFRAQLDLVASAGEQAAEAVPLRLVLPLASARNRIDGTRLHRRRRRGLGGCGVSARGRHVLSTQTAGYSPAASRNNYLRAAVRPQP